MPDARESPEADPAPGGPCSGPLRRCLRPRCCFGVDRPCRGLLGGGCPVSPGSAFSVCGSSSPRQCRRVAGWGQWAAGCAGPCGLGCLLRRAFIVLRTAVVRVVAGWLLADSGGGRVWRCAPVRWQSGGVDGCGVVPGVALRAVGAGWRTAASFRARRGCVVGPFRPGAALCGTDRRRPGAPWCCRRGGGRSVRRGVGVQRCSCRDFIRPRLDGIVASTGPLPLEGYTPSDEPYRVPARELAA